MWFMSFMCKNVIFPFQVNSVHVHSYNDLQKTDVGVFLDTYEFSFRSLLNIKQLGNYKKAS